MRHDDDTNCDGPVDPEDRLVDALLEEAVGAARAPDLTDRIAAELRRDTDVDEPAPITRHPSAQVRTGSRGVTLRRAWIVAGFAAGVLLGCLWAARTARLDAVTVRVQVVQGSVEIGGQVYVASATDAVRPVILGELLGDDLRESGSADGEPVTLAVGDEIVSEDGATVRLLPFGQLALESESTVEVVAMAWTKRDGALVVGSLAFGAVAGAFTWSRFDDAQPVQAGERAEQAPDTEPVTRETASDEVEELRKEIERLRSENEALVSAASRETVEAPTETTPEEVPLAIDLIEAGGAEHLLEGIDFALIGSTSNEMAPLIKELADALARDEQPLELIGKIQALNGALVSEAGKIVAAGIEGFGANGAYTHPSVAGNSMMATLAAAGLGLDAQQRERLQRLMVEHGELDRGVRIGEASREVKLESLIEEVEHKQRFYDEARAMLNAEQADLFQNKERGERIGLELHGPALVLGQYAKQINVPDRASFAVRVSSQLGKGLDLDVEGSLRLRRLVKDWATAYPDDYFSQGADTLEAMGMMKTSRVRDAARNQLALMQRVLAEFGSQMTAEQRENIVNSTAIYVPVPK